MMIAAFAPYMTYKLIAFMGSDMYHLMSAEQEAKHAMNRPLPVRASMCNPSQVLGGDNDGGNTPPPPAQPSGGQTTNVTATSSAPGAGAGGGGAVAGGGSAGAGSAGAAGGGAAAAAGPVIIGAQVVKGAATAGPDLGNSVGNAAMDQGEAAQPTPPASQPPSVPQTVFIPSSSTPPPEPPPAPVLEA
jgi:hypothetical protein